MTVKLSCILEQQDYRDSGVCRGCHNGADWKSLSVLAQLLLRLLRLPTLLAIGYKHLLLACPVLVYQ